MNTLGDEEPDHLNDPGYVRSQKCTSKLCATFKKYDGDVTGIRK